MSEGLGAARATGMTFEQDGAQNRMADLTRYTQLMKSDWDRRVRHDYRFWMSDGYGSDEEMWAAGERDLKILLDGLETHPQQVFLDLGCGVGRVLKAAMARFDRVIGLDVSASAIEKARELIGSNGGVELHVGSGVDLRPIENDSVDIAVSFAAISSIPTEVIANYLCEINRVLKPNGTARLQLYIGSQQPACRKDTLQLRCYQRENLESALTAAGFCLEGMQELVLPLQVSFRDLGIEAVIASARKVANVSRSADEIAKMLLPDGEQDNPEGTLGQDLEYWMSLNYADHLADQGNFEQAKRTLDYAATLSQTTAIDVRDLLNRIVDKIERA